MTLGATNFPVTVTNKRTPSKPTGDTAKKAESNGRIYAFEGEGRLEIHKMIRAEYVKIHERAIYKNTYEQAAKAILRITSYNVCYTKLLRDKKGQQ